MLLCIGQNISEASSHLQLLPDLLERDDGFPQLNCSSLLSFEPQKKASFLPGGMLAVHCMGLVRKRHTH